MASQADRRAATVGTILAEARRLFTERGFEATSIDEIAEAAGVAKGAVYHHFTSKEAVFQRVLEDMQAQIAASEFPRTRLRPAIWLSRSPPRPCATCSRQANRRSNVCC